MPRTPLALNVIRDKTGALDHVPLPDLQAYETGLYRFLESRDPAILVMLHTGQRIDDEIALRLDAALEHFARDSASRLTRKAA